MPTGPKGQKRPADVVSNAVHVMKVLTGEADDATPADDGAAKATVGRLHGFLKSSVIAPTDFDFTAPVLSEPLGSDEGQLHS